MKLLKEGKTSKGKIKERSPNKKPPVNAPKEKNIRKLNKTQFKIILVLLFSTIFTIFYIKSKQILYLKFFIKK